MNRVLTAAASAMLMVCVAGMPVRSVQSAAPVDLRAALEGTAESNMGRGVYEMTADTWGYRDIHMQSTSGPIGGPFKISVTRPAPMRWFKIRREPGKIVLEGAGDDRREYEGPFFTFMQKGQITRNWRRVPSSSGASTR